MITIVKIRQTYYIRIAHFTMKKNGLLLLCTWIVTAVSAQLTYETKIVPIPLAKEINLSDPVVDYDPKLVLLKSIPQPASELKLKKQQLDQLRKDSHLKTKAAYLNKTSAPAPTVLTNFAGNVTQGTPNDNDLAISNGGFVISVVNSNLNIFDSTGRNVLSRTLSVFANILGSLNRTYDPRVIYDPESDRFILVFLQGSTSADTRIIVAFSQSNNPTQKWNFYTIPGNVTGDSSWSDYPILSLSKQELFITVNRVKDNTPWQQGFITSYVWQCDKQKGYEGSDTINPRLYNNITYNGKSIWNVCPVKGGSGLYGPNMYFLSKRPADLINDSLFLHEITNTNASGVAQFTTKILKTSIPYGLQPNAIQPNGKKLQTNDARVLSACMEHGIIHYVGNSIDSSILAPAVYYGRVYGIYGNNPVQEGKIISYDTMDIGYPSISYIGDGGGDNSMLITFSHVSRNLFPGTCVVFADRFGNLSAPVVVKQGENNISILGDSVDRWGDYTGNQRRYNRKGESWINGSYGFSTGTNRTWIAQIRSNDPTLGISTKTSQKLNVSLYPNPGQEITTVEFDLTESKVIQFDVIDLQGKEVVGLLREKAKAGRNRFTFDAQQFSPGTYYLMIRDENKTVLGKHSFMVRH